MSLQTIKEYMETTVGGNTVQDYLQALLVFFLFYLGVTLVYRVVLRHLDRVAKQTATDVDDLMVALLSRLGNTFFLILALYLATSFLNLPSAVHLIMRGLLIIVFTIRAAYLTQEALRYGIRHMYMRKSQNKSDPATESAVTSIIGVLRWIIWLIALLFLLDNLGFNISTMVANIGITGIAVGMASQAILGDMFSAFAIFLDKPFQVGDFVIIDNFMGSIEHIGIKTTRIRSLFGEQLVFANSDLTKSRIKNYKKLVEPRGSINFTLPFDTPAQQLRQAREVILKSIGTISNVRIDHVHLMRFGVSGYEYEAAFYVLKGNVSRNFDIQQDVFFKVAEDLQNAGIKPTAQAQDILLKRPPLKSS